MRRIEVYFATEYTFFVCFSDYSEMTLQQMDSGNQNPALAKPAGKKMRYLITKYLCCCVFFVFADKILKFLPLLFQREKGLRRQA